MLVNTVEPKTQMKKIIIINSCTLIIHLPTTYHPILPPIIHLPTILFVIKNLEFFSSQNSKHQKICEEKFCIKNRKGSSFCEEKSLHKTKLHLVCEQEKRVGRRQKEKRRRRKTGKSLRNVLGLNLVVRRMRRRRRRRRRAQKDCSFGGFV
jgi:hypothetical protein